jgi:hypothetical protein
MQTQTPAPQPTGCCPPFDPEPWKDRELEWRDKPFVRDHVHSLFHVPLDMGRKVLRNKRRIDAAQAQPLQPLMLSDEKSPWGADIYIEVAKPVPGAEMTTLSGKFLTRVYDGPFSDARKWVEDMKRFVQAKGRTLDKLYFAYTTCPRCARAYGHNYVVGFAKVLPPS